MAQLRASLRGLHPVDALADALGVVALAVLLVSALALPGAF